MRIKEVIGINSLKQNTHSANASVLPTFLQVLVLPAGPLQRSKKGAMSVPHT